jgi:hypothetical protein
MASTERSFVEVGNLVRWRSTVLTGKCSSYFNSSRSIRIRFVFATPRSMSSALL